MAMLSHRRNRKAGQSDEWEPIILRAILAVKFPVRRFGFQFAFAVSLGALLATSAGAQTVPKEQALWMASFEAVWSAVRDHNPDVKLNGLDWRAIHETLLPRIEHAASIDEVRGILREMIGRLGVSHYAIIPADLYAAVGSESAPAGGKSASAGIETVILDGKAVVKSVEPNSAAARAGVQPGMVVDGIDGTRVAKVLESANATGDTESQRIAARSVAQKLDAPGDGAMKLDLVDASGRIKHVELNRTEAANDDSGHTVEFGNLPGMHVEFESRTLPGGAGYIRFNEFLNPVNLMPRFESALHGFAHAPGVILDLRGNPGGIGIMAMGIAGFFIPESGRQLGEMKMRETTIRFTVFPRAETYAGKVAILLDEGSASTTEILAQGLQDLKRARIFGTRSAGAALPSDIIRLPDGDGFQYPTASYTSVNGRVLEGNGVVPDVEVRESREAIAAGRDAVVEAARDWIAQR